MSIDMGITRYKEQRESKDRSYGKPELRLIEKAIKTVAPQLQAMLDHAVQGHPMRGVKLWGPILRQLPPERSIAVAMITLFNHPFVELPIYTASMKIATAIRTELKFTILREQFRDIYSQYDYKTGGRWTPVVVREASKAANITLEWDQAASVHIGSILLKLITDHTDLFEYRFWGRPGKTVTRIVLSSKLIEYIENQHEDLALLSPWNLPMIIPPKDWTSPTDGGYVFIPGELVKRPAWDTEDFKMSETLHEVYEVVNTLQKTAWQVNTEVLEVAEILWRNGGDIAGMPPREHLELPAKPADIGSNEEALKTWKRQAAQVYDENARLITQRRSCMMQLWIARRFSKYDSIYFPWSLDWRGRAYPVGTHLHPQGDDLGRGLLRFATAAPLGDHGLRWLSIHLANAIGWDKVSFDERLRLLNERRDEITRWVSDPLEHKGWMSVDEPFKALAAAYEWVAAGKLRDPSTYLSRIPVAVDGSCNGLQHFSAIGRDPVGAKSTNLAPSDRPLDIYRDVAEACNRRIEEDCQREDSGHVCHLCRGKVSRNIVKRGVMTTPYGVTRFGMQSQLFSGNLLAEITGDESKFTPIAMYLRDVIYDAVGDVVVAAREYMDWLREVAEISAKEQHELFWLTPMGFPVVQVYRNRTEKEIKTSLQKIKIFIPQKGTVSAYKQALGLPPNFIHSLDATHMMMTVLASKAAGITDFSMVHDSYATHAGNVQSLSKILRECFVQLHQEKPIEQFLDQVKANIKAPLPELPKQGSFDLTEVLRSPYFFH